MYSAHRLKLVYPYNYFRAEINYKNTAAAELWAYGQVYRDKNGQLYIITEDTGDEGRYLIRQIYADTLCMWTFFSDGHKNRIYESDIITITQIKTPEQDKASEDRFDLDEGKSASEGGGEELSEDSTPPHEPLECIPEDAEIISEIKGDVCISAGVACIRHIDANSGQIVFEPLYPYFGLDFLPLDCYVVEVIGNISETPELLDEIFEQSQCQDRNDPDIN
ncbi:MAG: hypothetical protein II664_01185 [Oscillospiraceae bacterium]|nr:hypothetical protein [Oscillospiraceae bacterium]